MKYMVRDLTVFFFPCSNLKCLFWDSTCIYNIVILGYTVTILLYLLYYYVLLYLDVYTYTETHVNGSAVVHAAAADTDQDGERSK